MDNSITNKSCYSSGDSSASSITTNSTTTTSDPSSSSIIATTNRDHFLRHLNKLSHKISKPTSSSPAASFLRRPPPDPPMHHPPPPPVPPLQQQPPVYNINKSDFRDVVQKLTGSPAHERIPTPAQPPIHAPKPASSRLQRIRPPPLVQLSNRPAPLLNCAAPPMNPSAGGYIRQPAPLSPLPPLPSCHAAAESPISAYMRFLHRSASASAVEFPNPTALNTQPIFPPPQSHHHPMNPPPSLASETFVPPPSSPLPFGCLLSPKSPCPLLSPNLLFSPTGTGPLGFPPLPVSPAVPSVPSPKWRDL